MIELEKELNELLKKHAEELINDNNSFDNAMDAAIQQLTDKNESLIEIRKMLEDQLERVIRDIDRTKFRMESIEAMQGQAVPKK
jgi:hypothetical protein